MLKAAQRELWYSVLQRLIGVFALEDDQKPGREYRVYEAVTAITLSVTLDSLCEHCERLLLAHWPTIPKAA